MSNLIPPLMCSTPPPLEPLDDDDDEFGDFTTAVDSSYVCDTLSIPNTPLDTPKKEPILPVDINSNSHEDLVNEKDYQDKRKTEQLNNDQITMHINSLNTMPNLSDVPMEPMREETVESDTITKKVISNQDFENHSSIGDQNVPLYLNCTENVIGDFYREEPPEIIPDDPDEDFGDFEFNPPIPILENEVTDEVSSSTSIPINQNGELNSVTEFSNEGNLRYSLDSDINKTSIENTIIPNEFSKEIECENEIYSDKVDLVLTEVEKINDNVLQNNLEVCSVTVLEDTSEINKKIKDEQIDNVDSENYSQNSLEVGGANVEEGSSSYEKGEIVKCDVADEEEFGDYSCIEKQNASSANNSKPIIITDTDKSINSIVAEESSCSQNDDFGEFADFKSAEEMGVITAIAPSLATTSAEKDSCNEVENNFSATFASFEKNQSDDFGDFDDYTSSSPPIMLSLNTQNIDEKAENIIKETFPAVTNDNYDFCSYDFINEDAIFKEVKDITDTNALKYQWTKSQTQKSLLKSLNIDSRNILYGPGKNSSTPKFAANLGLTPLEPVKSEVLTTKPVRSSTPPSISSHSNSANSASVNDIPTAQFDWKESGLANPLDSSQASTILLDLEQLVASLDKSTSPTPTAECTKSDLSLDDWNLWLQSVSKEEHQTLPQPELKPSSSTSEENVSTIALQSERVENQSPLTTKASQIQISETPRPNIKSYDNESVHSLQFADVETEENEKPEQDEFSDFASFQPAEKPSEFCGWSNNTVLLRESYINNTETRKVDNNDEPGWLKPTILTPVLPRRENTFGDDDDFADFQMSLPTDKPALTVLPPSTNIINEESNVFTDKLNTNNKNMLSPEVNPHSNMSSVNTTNSIPINTILQPVSVFQHLESQSKNNDTFKINWPDPGITDEELDRFEKYSKSEECKKVNDIVPKSEALPERKLSGNTGSMLVEKSVVVPANKVVLPSKEVLLPPNDKVVISKDLVLPILESSPRKYTPMKSKADDDDWTDFISNPEPMKTMTKGTERTSTPELSLSIPQLSSIQPPKLPIPVITPKGLMQTKIPSSVTMNNVQKNIPQTPLHVKPPQDGFQPSIISQQYAIQFNQNSFAGLLQNTNYQTTSIPANMKSPSHNNPLQPKQQELANGTKSATNTAFLDDNDEWSDFISSRPAISESRMGNNMGADWNKSSQFWNNGMTTSTTNPSHIQMGINKRAVNGTVSSKKNIPSISSLPDLDFAAPKNRTFNKK